MTRDRSRRVDGGRTRQRHDDQGKTRDPGQSHVERSRVVIRGDRTENGIRSGARSRLPAAERAVCEETQAVGFAIRHDAAEQMAIVPETQLDLYRVDLDDPPRFFDLRHGDIAEADPLDQPLSLQRGKRADAGRKRHSGIGNVQLIELDACDSQRTATRFAGSGQMLGAAVRHPPPVRARQAALCRDDDLGTIARPCRQGASDQPLVMAALAVVQTVGVSGIEECDARVQRGVQHFNRSVLVARALGREAHAPERGRAIVSHRSQRHRLLRRCGTA